MPNATIGTIKRAVAEEFGVSVMDLIAVGRCRLIARPRQVGMYLVRHLTSLSLPQIGRAFGNRDHTTALHSVRKITSLMADNEAFRDRVEGLRVRLSSAAICPVYAVGLAAHA